MRVAISASVAVCISALSSAPSAAQAVPCGADAAFIAHLEKEWGEDPAVIALDAAGRMVRIVVSPETGTWSMLITAPGGPTCLIRHGTAWEPLEPATEPGDPS